MNAFTVRAVALAALVLAGLQLPVKSLEYGMPEYTPASRQIEQSKPSPRPLIVTGVTSKPNGPKTFPPAPEPKPTPSVVTASPVGNFLLTDAAWSWWCEPKVVRYKGARDKIYLAYLSKSSAIRGYSSQWAASYDVSTGVVERFDLGNRFYTDDHNAPCILPPAPGDRNTPFYVFYTGHNQGNRIYYRAAAAPESVKFGAEKYVEFSSSTLTYVQAYRQGSRIILITRLNPADGLWAFRISSDNGKTWGAQKTLFSGGSRSFAYVATSRSSAGSDVLNFVAGDIPARPYMGDENTTQEIRAGRILLKSGVILNMKGNPIGNIYTGKGLPVTPGKLTLVYKPRYEDENTRLFAVSSADPNRMEILFMNFRDWEGKSDGMYQYAVWNGSRFLIRPMVATGKTYDGVSYFGGGDIGNAGVVCLARESKGQWLIERWKTVNAGLSWNVRRLDSSWDPVISYRPMDIANYTGARLPDESFVWVQGLYRGIQDFDTGIVYQH